MHSAVGLVGYMQHTYSATRGFICWG